MSKVFISYRRDDASANAGRLCDWLKRQFGAPNVFLDTESIAPGDAFPRVLEQRLADSDALVAVIGPKWATITDKAGNLRLADPNDFVALEVATAMKREMRVIPALVGGATMPRADQLPPALQGFEQRNALAIDDSRFAQDFDNLVDAVKGRPRGFARRELDRLQRGVRVLKLGSLVSPAIALALLFAAWTQLFDAFLLDTRVASYTMWLGEQFAASPGDAPVVIVAIDEDSERRLGRPYARTPEWRIDHARLIDRLVDAGVAAVAFDLYIESENPHEAEAGAELASAIRRARQKNVHVVVGIRGFAGSGPRLLASLRDAGAVPGSLCIGSRFGYAFDAPLAVSAEPRGNRTLAAANPALGLAAAIPGHVEAIDQERREIALRQDGRTRYVGYSVLDDAGSPSTECPTLGQGGSIASLLVRLSPSGYWREPPRRIGYAQVLDPATPLRPDALRGKTALVGVMLAAAGDRHGVVRGWKRDDLYGVELHADTMSNLERGVALRPLGPTAQLLLMLALALAGAAASFLLFDRARRHRVLGLGVALAAYVGVAIAIYAGFAILLNILYDVTAFAAAYLLMMRMQRKGLAGTNEGGPQ